MSAQPPHASQPPNRWGAPAYEDSHDPRADANPAWLILFLKIVAIIILVPAVALAGGVIFCGILIATSGGS